MYYQINLETQKLELVFSKAEYLALPNETKTEIKSTFLFSKSLGGWVSRSRIPNIGAAERIAQKLGAENRGKTGDLLTFEEQQERKAERAEARADRMEARAAAAENRGESLQAPLNRMRGDTAFFTQPNINSAGGRSFTNYRNRLFAAYERGYEEFKKSEYYAERAEIARKTASGTKPTDKGFCERRIAEAQKTIKAQRQNIDHYRETLERVENGEEIKRYSGEILTRETVLGWIENAEITLENAISKEIYYRETLESLGGIEYSRENIKPGYIVELTGSRVPVEVVGTGPKFFTYKSFSTVLKASYGEIRSVVEANEKTEPSHPFAVGDKFTVKLWNGDNFENTPCEIVKTTDKSVTVLNTLTGKKSVRKPQLREGRNFATAENPEGRHWAIFMSDNYSSGYFKPAPNAQ